MKSFLSRSFKLVTDCLSVAYDLIGRILVPVYEYCVLYGASTPYLLVEPFGVVYLFITVVL
jgi:hypothetical protein